LIPPEYIDSLTFSLLLDIFLVPFFVFSLPYLFLCYSHCHHYSCTSVNTNIYCYFFLWFLFFLCLCIAWPLFIQFVLLCTFPFCCLCCLFFISSLMSLYNIICYTNFAFHPPPPPGWYFDVPVFSASRF
jgi:hypothetical protein